MKHEDILKLLFAVSQANPQNDTIAFDVTDPFRPMPVQTKNILNKEYFDLMVAGPFLYQSLYNATVLLDAISVGLERINTPEARVWIEAIEAQSRQGLGALMVATEGSEKVIKESNAETMMWYRKN
ncbi:hypothetical protein AH03_24 [Erwinia phage AH03]|uniref:Uncharacterized protein n=1 Tax=Erwinia phage AH03 TaxID=2869568 RepID=A0AAE8BPY9_9CAUD|nr:hypothetical protein AH03_24 [Erwinia phage AH03]